MFLRNIYSIAAGILLLFAPARTFRYRGTVREEDGVFCLVSANQPFAHDPSFVELANGCLDSNPATRILVFALQDHDGSPFPEQVNTSVRLFHRWNHWVLDQNVGKGTPCQGEAGSAVSEGRSARPGLAWVLDRIGNATGLGCGGVYLVAYSSDGASLRLSGQLRKHHAPSTQTTRKGTLAVGLLINDREVIVASTHGTKGTRADNKDTEEGRRSCPGNVKQKLIKQEQTRVLEFRTAFQEILALRDAPGAGERAVVWGGDFNPRTASESTGCPVYPALIHKSIESFRTHKYVKNLKEALQKGRDTMGEDPLSGSQTTYSGEITKFDIEEVKGLECPTYRKVKPKGDKYFFLCEEDGHNHYYDVRHSPSWTDRVFVSNGNHRPWLQCGSLQRVPHETDHDAVFVTCKVTGKRATSAETVANATADVLRTTSYMKAIASPPAA